MIVSFAWTTAVLLAGQKTVTRRDWNHEYGRRFREGMEVTAYDRSPRVHGQPVARLVLTQDARYEKDAWAPDSDYAGEGFAFYRDHPEMLPKKGRFAYLKTVSWESFCDWRNSGGYSWVMRFRVVELLVPAPRAVGEGDGNGQ